jgi:hypothetical protein
MLHNMRIAIAAAVLGSLAGCMVGDAPPGPSGDDDDGDGNGSDQTPTPRLVVSVDKATLSTELRTTNTVAVTLQASGGFSGAVALSASVVDGAGAAMPGWTATLDAPAVEVPPDGAATAVATVVVPAENRGLAGTLKIDATSSLGAQMASSEVSVANQITFAMTLTEARCAYPSGTLTVKVGTKIRWLNMTAANRIAIHMERPARDGLVHQDDPGSAPGEAYEQTTAVNGDGQLSGNPVAWYCHAPGADLGGNNPRLLVVP